MILWDKYFESIGLTFENLQSTEYKIPEWRKAEWDDEDGLEYDRERDINL